MSRYVTPLLRDRLLRPRDVAELAGVKPEQVYEWRFTGRLVPAVETPGGHGRYRRQDIEAFLRSKPLT